MQRVLRPFVWIRVADPWLWNPVVLSTPFCVWEEQGQEWQLSPLCRWVVQPLEIAPSWAWWHTPLIRTQEAETRRFVRPAWSATELVPEQSGPSKETLTPKTKKKATERLPQSPLLVVEGWGAGLDPSLAQCLLALIPFSKGSIHFLSLPLPFACVL